MPPEHGPSSSQCPQCGCMKRDFELPEEFRLKRCPHCDRVKCSCCDMGDNAPCIGCEHEG